MTCARLVGVLALVALASACSPDPKEQAARSIADGSALKAVQAHFDNQRQCAPVLTGIMPIEIAVRHAGVDSVRALVAAGLLTRSPLTSNVSDVRFVPAPDATKWFRETKGREGQPTTLALCYARRQVTRVWQAGGEAPALQYAYRLVGTPDWTRHSDMVTAFPFLAPALSTELTADERVPWREGKWDLSLPTPAARIPGIEAEGFFTCPPEDDTPALGCQ